MGDGGPSVVATADVSVWSLWNAPITVPETVRGRRAPLPNEKSPWCGVRDADGKQQAERRLVTAAVCLRVTLPM